MRFSWGGWSLCRGTVKLQGWSGRRRVVRGNAIGLESGGTVGRDGAGLGGRGGVFGTHFCTT